MKRMLFIVFILVSMFICSPSLVNGFGGPAVENCSGGRVDVAALGGNELETVRLGGGFDGLGGGVE